MECVVGTGDCTLLLLGVVGVVAVRLMATGYSGRGRLTVCSVNLAKLAGAARGVGRTLWEGKVEKERGRQAEKGCAERGRDRRRETVKVEDE